LRTTNQRRQDIERRLESIAPASEARLVPRILPVDGTGAEDHGSGPAAEARSVEQVLIEWYKSKGVPLQNKINSVAKSNPEHARALKLGKEILHNAGIPGS
jgi:hypothetical protein